MIHIFDTYYFEEKARTVCVSINEWTDKEITTYFCETIEGIKQYESGAFYLRELPCITSLFNKINLIEGDIIVIDGFVILDDNHKNGLGGYLYEHLKHKNPIIGVAKNDFVKLQNLKMPIFRGDSKKPLYITSKGIDLAVASEYIKNMDGPYRIPTILKIVDQKSREI